MRDSDREPLGSVEPRSGLDPAALIFAVPAVLFSAVRNGVTAIVLGILLSSAVQFAICRYFGISFGKKSRSGEPEVAPLHLWFRLLLLSTVAGLLMLALNAILTAIGLNL